MNTEEKKLSAPPGLLLRILRVLKERGWDMKTTVKLTPLRIIGAFAVAIAADLVQLPLTGVAMSGVGAVPAEGMDAAVDVAAALITNFLLGFHWALLPTFMIELIPGVDVLPTWTACVAFVIWRRHKAEKENVVKEIEAVQVDR